MAKTTTDTVQDFKRIKEEILRGDIKPVYLLFGKEHYYIDELCKLLMDNVVPEEERDFGQIVFYGGDTTPNQVVSAARQFPMMISRQIVVLKEAQLMNVRNVHIEDIGIYFEGIMPSTVLVICYKTNNDPTKSGKSIDKRSAFYKQAVKFGCVFESNPIQDRFIPKWIDSYLAVKGMSIAPEASALLTEYAGTDLQKIVLAFDKLLKVLPEGTKRISEKDIADNVGMSRDYSVFELTKALSKKDSLKCFKIVEFYADSPKRYPLPMTLAALSNHFIKLLRYHSLLQAGLRGNAVLAQLGVNPYFAEEYNTAIKNYPVNKVMRAIAYLKAADRKSKSNARGEASDGDILKELVAKILQ